MDLIKQLREEAERLSAHSLDRGVQEAGIAANLADRAADTIESLLAALKKASQLAEIATDWNLDEVEIDGEMVKTHDLRDEFDAAISKATQS